MIIGISAPHMPRCEHRGRLRAIEIPHSTPGWLSQMSGWFRSTAMHMYHTCMYSHSYSYSCSIMRGCRYTIHTVLCLHIALREVVCTHGMTMKKDENGMSKILHVHLYHAALAYLCTPCMHRFKSEQSMQRQEQCNKHTSSTQEICTLHPIM